MRKMVTIRKIIDVHPIPEADRIEVATVDGWNVVVKKDEFKKGDYVAYFEIDSWVPHDIAPFLTKEGCQPKCYNGILGQRLRTVKLRGQISQGLILPISIFANNEKTVDIFNNPKKYLNEDVSSYLGVVKWEIPEVATKRHGDATNHGVGMSPFPGFIPKTDQERVQNLVEKFSGSSNDIHNCVFEITEKLDGTSCTIFLDEDNKLNVCSRNYLLHHEGKDSVYGIVAKKYKFKEKLRRYNLLDNVKKFFHLTKHIIPAKKNGMYNIAFQGEIVGPKIQNNKYKLNELMFFVYDIYDIKKGEYLSPTRCRTVCEELGLNHVPVIETVYWFKPVNEESHESPLNCVEKLIKMADGYSLIGNNPTQLREGLVFKRDNGLTDLFNIKHTERFSFKAISNKFLLKD